jgi:hypothetical protein
MNTFALVLAACLPAEDLRSQLMDVSVLTGVQVLYDWNEPGLAVLAPRLCFPAGTIPALILRAVVAPWPLLTADPVNDHTWAVVPLESCAPWLPPLEAPLPPCLPALPASRLVHR